MTVNLTIGTRRLILRPFCEADLDDWVRINADPEVVRFLGGKVLDRGESWRQIAVFLGHAQLRGYTMLAIEERATGALLGRCGPWFPEGWPMLEVGWVVDPRRRREGIATEAARGALDWCFDQLEIDKICSLIRPENIPSARVAAKVGATIERQLPNFLGSPADLWIHRPEGA